MPQLSDILNKKKKAFKKKSYRAWDLTGEQAAQDLNLLHIAESESPNPITAEDIVPEQLDNNQVTIEEPLDNKEGTQREQTDSKSITNEQQIEDKEVTNREPLDNIIDNDWITASVQKLTGIQELIFYHLLDLCTTKGSLSTGPIDTNVLANVVGCSYGTVKTSIKRLIDKNLLQRKPGKTAKGGFINLEFSSQTKMIALEVKRDKTFTSLSQESQFFRKRLDNTLDNKHDTYSSSNIYKTTTTDLPEDWKKINFESLRELGFSETQLLQLYERGLNTPDIIQSSIDHFAFGLECNDKLKIYKDPLNVFMGVLRKGQRWHEANYQSPQELALKTLIEEKKKQKEQYLKLLDELTELEFPDWEQSLTTGEKERIVPENILKAGLQGAISGTLRSYFIDNILRPRLKNQGLL